jgi:hypothetical protein
VTLIDKFAPEWQCVDDSIGERLDPQDVAARDQAKS